MYEKAGFADAEADQAAAVFMFVLGNAVGAAATISLTRRLNRDGGKAEELLSETIAQASEIAMRFPRLRSRLEVASGTDYGAAPDSSFEFGLKAILDGFEDRLAGRDGSPSTSG